MFAGVAPRYDLGNRLLSFGRDRSWRRAAALAAALRPGERALDACAGTGDLASELAARGARVVALDFCPEMIARGSGRAARARASFRFVLGDVLSLPFPAETFEVATIAFGLRNLAEPLLGLRELKRVLRPGGRLVVLEFADPSPGLFGSLYRAYARRLLPVLGGWITGRREAYEYLPRTVFAFGGGGAVARAMEGVGLSPVTVRSLTGGIVACVRGVKGA